MTPIIKTFRSESLKAAGEKAEEFTRYLRGIDYRIVSPTKRPEEGTYYLEVFCPSLHAPPGFAVVVHPFLAHENSHLFD